jgi:hypothetical protein
MRRVLPGGATLSEGKQRPVVCLPGVAVIERTSKPPPPPTPPPVPPQTGVSHAVGLLPPPPPRKPLDWLPTVKQVLGVLTALVGLIGAILTLFGWPRRKGWKEVGQEVVTILTGKAWRRLSIFR